MNSFLEKGMPYTEVNKITKQSDALTAFFSGVTVCFIDGFSECLSLDCRTYPMRSVTEPWKDKVLRGSRDGFVETLVLNAALLRRRIRDPQLSLELMGVGTRSRSDVAVCYMEDKVDKKLLDSIKRRIQAIRCRSVDNEYRKSCRVFICSINGLIRFRNLNIQNVRTPPLLRFWMEIL